MLPFALGRAALKYAKELGIPVSMGFHCQAENFTAHFGIEDSITNAIASLMQSTIQQNLLDKHLKKKLSTKQMLM